MRSLQYTYETRFLSNEARIWSFITTLASQVSGGVILWGKFYLVHDKWDFALCVYFATNIALFENISLAECSKN